MRGYKAFNKGLICRDKQYQENTIFEEERAEICESGMHFCKNPLDVLDYYDLVDSKCELSEFAEVEALDEVKTDDNKKFCTKKLKIGAKLDLSQFIRASFDFLYENAEETSGHYSKVATSGDDSQVATSGDDSKVATSGHYSKVATSGDDSKVALYGDNNVGANIGIDGMIKGKIGSWITLAEYKRDDLGNYICVCVKSAQIDGVKLKENVFYTLINGEFTEIK